MYRLTEIKCRGAILVGVPAAESVAVRSERLGLLGITARLNGLLRGSAVTVRSEIYIYIELVPARIKRKIIADGRVEVKQLGAGLVGVPTRKGVAIRFGQVVGLLHLISLSNGLRLGRSAPAVCAEADGIGWHIGFHKNEAVFICILLCCRALFARDGVVVNLDEFGSAIR